MTFPIPETLYDPSLFLSPHIFLLGLVFRHQAFAAPNLVDPEALFRLRVPEGKHEMELPFRTDIKNVYVFRKAIYDGVVYVLSPTERLTYQTLRNWVVRIGLLMGLLFTVIMYSLRYNAANEWDQSGAYRPAALYGLC